MILSLVILTALAGVSSAGAGAQTFEFPSSSSSVVSDGALSGSQVGYFWTKERGDKVAQTFSGPAYVDHAALSVQPVTTTLTPGAEVDWTMSINGIDIGSFVVPSGTTSPIALERTFAPIAGPSYAVSIRVTNVVQSGAGAHSLASTGSSGQHSLELSESPAPDTYLTSGPEATTTATSAIFAFGSSQLDVTGFQCSLDHTSFVPCSSPKSYVALSPGAHSFEVSAIDIVGNIDPTPAVWQWSVAAPSPAKVRGPKSTPSKCKKGFKKAKRHGKSVCIKKKRHKKHSP